jgi:hypothetical protein
VRGHGDCISSSSGSSSSSFRCRTWQGLPGQAAIGIVTLTMREVLLRGTFLRRYGPC